MTTQNVYDDINDTPRDDPTGFAIWIEFDRSMSEEHMSAAAQFYAGELKNLLTSAKEPWGYGRAMVATVLPAHSEARSARP